MATAVRQEVVVLQPLLLLVGVNLQEQPLPTEKQPFREPVVRLDLVCARRDLLSQLGAAQVLEEEASPKDAAEFAEGLVEPIPPAVCAQPAEQQRRRDGTCFDREHHLEKVLPVGLDQVPVDRVAEQILDVRVPGLFGWAEKAQVFPIADARHELDAEQMGEAETGVDWAWVSP
jgi:hypothetical protein